ncbi:TetR/AcrR family transcriptional regulator [Patulibacter medicamentivorans]|jgi:AcrR family transcriptional regulator|uniref:TetR/AcrR family transcriptional regulator n=1 Tax=Patulibacter medicamentivorans TaxID=1097667 RepID=UPI0002FF1ECE|nr:TetR/AcrR family transcriptional regulator [Patulibacter medicamentivorans]
MPSITRTTQAARAKRREEIRGRLLQAVEQCLESETYTDVSIERLVRQAGIARSTFYVYFEDKGDLLRALAEDVIVAIIESAGYWWALPPDATKDDLREAMERIADTYRTHRVVMSAVVEATAYDERIAEQFAVLLERTISEVAAHIADGQRRGFAHDDIDAQQTALWITWMTERGLFQLITPAGAVETERLMQALTDIVWSTLYARTRS